MKPNGGALADLPPRVVATVRLSAPGNTAGPRARGPSRAIALAAAAAVAALGVRLDLARRRDCISADGVPYVAAARAFHRGDWARGLASFHTPGYPLAIAAAYPLAGDWERAGIAVSLAAGVASVVPLAGLARLAGLEGPALAATLAAFVVTPYPAGYASKVRTEALYALCVLVALWAAAAAALRGRPGAAAVAGVATGLAYLARPEGLALVVPLGAWLAGTLGRPHGLRAAAVVALGAAVVAAPYVLHLRRDTGRWMVSRKSAAVLSHAIDSATGEAQTVGQAESDRTPLREVLAGRWSLYARKVAIDAWRAVVALARAVYPAFVPFAVLGVALGRRRAPALTRLLAAVAGFYLVFYALTHPGTRFFTAVALALLVWCGAGLADALARARARGPVWAAALVVVVLAATLPETFRVENSCAYTRTLGETIARLDPGRPRVAAADFRVAFYAAGRYEPLPGRLDPAGLRALAGRAGWLVALDGDLGPAARRLLEAGGRGPLASAPTSGGKRTARLYRLDGLANGG